MSYTKEQRKGLVFRNLGFPKELYSDGVELMDSINLKEKRFTREEGKISMQKFIMDLMRDGITFNKMKSGDIITNRLGKKFNIEKVD